MQRPPAILEVVAGNAAGMSILVDDTLMIGRLAEGPGQLGSDEELSRSHATLSRDSSGYVAIEDLGSTNGTFVNGLRITGPQTLAVGDSIELGGTTLVVRELPSLMPVDTAPAAGVEPTAVPGAHAAVPALESEDEPPAPLTEELVEVEEPEEAGEPQDASEPEAPEPLPAAAEPALPSTLGLRLEIDFDAREATILLDSVSEPVLLRYDAGEWRAVV
jgi:pSer/pThr/pTyr-binding forkhead associated (FHA) protein